ncbi:White collar 1 protein [Ceratobasidium sp. AG-Ba]|nr:White collar 1 protein [Ceratobasidium sp. AG-Ba]
MSGYALEDIRGRNPRFMQAPGGHVLPPQACHPLAHPPAPAHPVSGRTHRGGPTGAVRRWRHKSGLRRIRSHNHTAQPDPNPNPIIHHPRAVTIRESYAYIPPPSSHVPAGSERTHTSKATVAHIKAKLDANEEVQTTILNYRRDGTPFWNWLSVVPVREAGEGSRFRYHVGIMVDLVQQPRAIIQTMQAGFYIRTQS